MTSLEMDSCLMWGAFVCGNGTGGLSGEKFFLLTLLCWYLVHPGS